MSSKGIHDDWSRKRKERNTKVKGLQLSNQNSLASDIVREKKKDSIIYNFNKENFERGRIWFDEGFSLNDAPDNLKDNASFIAGYQKAERVKYVNELSYQTGIEFYDRGVSFEEIPNIYKNNEFFMNGYNSCNKKSLWK